MLGLSILIVGGTVLVLSVAWQPLRRIVLGILPQNFAIWFRLQPHDNKWT